MEKLIVKERAIRERIANVINNSGLPAFIVKSILKDAMEQINILENEQYNKALEYVMKEKEENENKGVEVDGKN